MVPEFVPGEFLTICSIGEYESLVKPLKKKREYINQAMMMRASVGTERIIFD